ncbi:hypothetical protein KSD_00980 [Ktedonobacter sp. SOSP1-85]|nr:hypothetical protein KSD_00980 [Ktedonobacter sp. SOSP1-85]
MINDMIHDEIVSKLTGDTTISSQMRLMQDLKELCCPFVVSWSIFQEQPQAKRVLSSSVEPYGIISLSPLASNCLQEYAYPLQKPHRRGACNEFKGKGIL